MMFGFLYHTQLLVDAGLVGFPSQAAPNRLFISAADWRPLPFGLNSPRMRSKAEQHGASKKNITSANDAHAMIVWSETFMLFTSVDHTMIALYKEVISAFINQDK